MTSEIVQGAMVTSTVRLAHQLGEGGMGTVWVADHLGLDTQVAVKFINPELVRNDPGVITRFRREAAAAARIRNPHVVQVFDHGLTPEGTPFIVMELLHGESLGGRLARLGRLHAGEMSVLLAQTCKALTEAHSHGIVHRDIKPDNIFITQSAGELLVKVLDFGIAKQTAMPGYDQLTGTKMLVGTPEFMSPEQIMSARDVDFHADLWALSVVAYQALTGQMPFGGETVGALIVAITSAAFPPPTSVAPHLPASLDAWFSRALARSPQARFGSARELADSFGMHAASSVPRGTLIAAGPLVTPGVPPTRTVFGTPAPFDPAAASGPHGVHPGTLAGASATLHGSRERRTFALVAAATLVVALAGVAAVFVAQSSDDESSAVPAAPAPSTSPVDGPEEEQEVSSVATATAGGASDTGAVASTAPSEKPSPASTAIPAPPVSSTAPTTGNVPPPADTKASQGTPPTTPNRKSRLGF